MKLMSIKILQQLEIIKGLRRILRKWSQSLVNVVSRANKKCANRALFS